MELKIKEIQLPEAIEFNFEELKTELMEKTKLYETLVYTDEQIKEAKSDRAKLNGLKKALNDERIRREKEYMAPFNDFKAKINEIIGIIDKPINAIDTQVKEYENLKKEEKKETLVNTWNAKVHQDWLTFEKVFNPKWLNATFTLTQAEAEMDGVIEKVNNEIKTLEALDAFSFEAIEAYKGTLDVSYAIREGQRLADIQKRKEEAQKPKELPEPAPLPFTDEPKKVEPVKEVMRSWIGFKAYLSVEEARELATFLKARNIKIEKLEV